MRYLISGGGTGGHIYPALAIARKIMKEDEQAEVLYVGTENSMESEIIRREGIDFRTIRVTYIPRKIGKQLFIAMKMFFQGIKDSKKILNEFRPDIVIGTGGYVCGPIVYKAAKMKIPTLIHEQNVYPGITNRFLSRKVDKICINFEEAKNYFKNKDKIIKTGNPLRTIDDNQSRDKVLEEIGIKLSIPTVLSFGGSYGQKSLNEAVLNMIIKNKDNMDFQLIHVTGKNFIDDFENELKNNKIVVNEKIKIFPYLHKMPQIMKVVDLVVTSAGAITLSEISMAGVASILIPKAYTAGNHQEKNARLFEDKKASIVILEKDLTDGLIYSKINTLINDKDKLREMGSNALKLCVDKSNDKIYNEIVKLIK